MQPYYHRGREATERWVRQPEELGYRAVCLTVDSVLLNVKERDIRNGFLPPYAAPHDDRSGPFGQTELPVLTQPTWEDVRWLRGLTSLPLVLKGITTEEDALLAVEHGVAGVIVSTHGGRLLDGMQSAVECLPEVVAAVAGRAEVYLDSGVRRGTDILKALALGATAVGIGRPFFWGLAVDGAGGVTRVCELLGGELDLALGFCGLTSVRELGPRVVRIPAGWGSDGARYAP